MKKILVSASLVLMIAGCSNQDKEEQHKPVDTSKMIEDVSKQALEMTYSNDEIQAQTNYNDVFTQSLRNKFEQQNQSYNKSPIKKEIENIDIYINASNDVMYSLKLSEINDSSKNVDITERYGKIKIDTEDKKIKVDRMEEVGFNFSGGGNHE
ncbi:hypothetical protein CW670_11005 [Macrococcoides caseolyticum]|uniref:TrsH/TraH family protein n=1 Tax=Macrococcoides caseolyticum TaxID=69966 RepID=UPI000C3292C3|nr:TrsH/TraH family protein [Macrococcus caseolyticus]PKE73659.1 hypothetical protein CW670_11005 [Macrococcus caseolyticus]